MIRSICVLIDQFCACLQPGCLHVNMETTDYTLRTLITDIKFIK